MAKTNKEVRSDMAKEIRDKRKEKNTQLEQVEKTNFSQGLKDQMRKEIEENFEKDVKLMKVSPRYLAAKHTHMDEIKAKRELNKAKKLYEDSQKSYEEAQIAHRGKVEEFSENDAENIGERSQEKKEKLHGNKEAILKDLEENYVKIEKNAEMMGYKGKKVHINLPAVGNFEGFKFDYFVSNDYVRKNKFESNYELENKSYSMKEIGELLKAMNKYMKAMGVETDGDVDYENDLKYWENIIYRCNAGDCLKDVTGLDDWYRLKDKDVAGRKNSRVGWFCSNDSCNFYRVDRDFISANLFLRLSD